MRAGRSAAAAAPTPTPMKPAAAAPTAKIPILMFILPDSCGDVTKARCLTGQGGAIGASMRRL